MRTPRCVRSIRRPPLFGSSSSRGIISRSPQSGLSRLISSLSVEGPREAARMPPTVYPLVAGAKAQGDGLYVRYSKAQVKDSPDIDADQISADTESALYSYYGVGYRGTVAAAAGT